MAEKTKPQKISREERALQNELLRNIFHAKYELECATQNFSYATDPILIDMYSYQIKACQAKYQYLMNRAKEGGITEGFNILAYTTSR